VKRCPFPKTWDLTSVEPKRAERGGECGGEGFKKSRKEIAGHWILRKQSKKKKKAEQPSNVEEKGCRPSERVEKLVAMGCEEIDGVGILDPSA